MQHTFGEYDAEWSYEARSTARAREILELERGTAEYYVDFLDGDGLEALDRINSLGDLRELVANLMFHHMRAATAFPGDGSLRDRRLSWPRDYSQFLQAHTLDAALNVAVALTSRWRRAVLVRCWL